MTPYHFFNQVINIISILFFYTFHLSPSREWVTLKTLFLYIDINVNCRYQQHCLSLLLSLFLFYIRAYGNKNSARRLWMLLVIEVFFVISESSPSFPTLILTHRMLESFLLQTCCLQISTSLGDAWLHKNSFFANLWLKLSHHQCTYFPSTLFLLLFI